MQGMPAQSADSTVKGLLGLLLLVVCVVELFKFMSPDRGKTFTF